MSHPVTVSMNDPMTGVGGDKIRGLPGRLPENEHILWQGAPCWRSLARRMCHVRGIGLYLGIVVVGTGAAAAATGGSAEQALLTMAPLAIAGMLVMGFLFGLAWMTARSTEYTLTTHRLVMRFGVALPAVLAIPHKGIAHASVRMHQDLTGDLPIETKPGYHVSFRRAFPHARPWRLSRPQPMLRSVPGAGMLAVLLARTLAAAESESLQGRRAAPAPALLAQPVLEPVNEPVHEPVHEPEMAVLLPTG